MKELINRSYQAIIKRGLIKKETHIFHFLQKIDEEFKEVEDSCNEYYASGTKKCKEHYIEELTDLATVCFMQIKNLGYDPIEEFEKVVQKNENRCTSK